MATRRVTASDLTLLKQHLLDKAKACVHDASGLLQYKYVIPTYDAVPGADDESHTAERSKTGAYLQMYDWDSCFFAQFAHRAGIEGLPLSVVRNFLTMQEENGFIPRTVSPGRIWDQGDLCKPFLCQTLVQYLERTYWHELPDVRALLPGLRRYLEYFRKERQHESGLFFWRNVLESGVDDNYALIAPREAKKDEDQGCIRHPDGRLLAVDLNSYLVAEFRAFARLCCASDEIEQAREYFKLAHALAEKIETRLWDNELAMYVNVDPDDNMPVRMRSWVGLLPALLGATSDSQALKVLRANALDERHFLRKFGIASMAASEPLSNQAARGLYGSAIVCNWNGPVWVLPNVLTVRALVRLGLVREAKDVARRVVAAMVRDVKSNGMLHENYNADTGESLWAPQFMSWNIMALELIELLEKAARKRKVKSTS